MRVTEEEKKNHYTKMAQVAQNKVLRILDNCKIKDMRPIRDMLEKFDMLSVNQTAAQIKLTEAWKASNDEDYPIHMKKPEQHTESTREVRAGTRREMEEGGRTRTLRESFTRDAGRLWNQAPLGLNETIKIAAAKRGIKDYCRTLSI